MTAALLAALTAAGISLSLTGRGTLHYQGDRCAVDRWLPQIRQHKAELLALLSANTEPPPLTQEQRDDIREIIDERSAILEHEAGMRRHEADARAASAMRIYRYRLTDRPADWLVMIAPGCNLDEVRRALIDRFGIERLVEVHAYRPEVTL
jgi:hypothetical protein